METALLMPPFLLLCFGLIEISMLHLAASNIEGQVAEAARQIRTGNVQKSANPRGEFRRLLCVEVTFIDCEDLILDVRRFETFGDIQFEEFIDNEGNPIDTDETFDPGDARDVVLVRVVYKWKILTPFLGIYLGDGGGDTKLLQAAAVFRVEPFRG